MHPLYTHGLNLSTHRLLIFESIKDIITPIGDIMEEMMMGDAKLLQEIGIRINIRRKELGMTQEQLAEFMDVSIQMISNLELGKKAIRPENLVKLCSVLKISADYVLCGIHADWEMSALNKKIASLSAEDQKLIELLADRLCKNGRNINNN
ncbi:MAG: helix-turn-helix domain-containing protein [Eubacteriales bacterium]